MEEQPHKYEIQGIDPNGQHVTRVYVSAHGDGYNALQLARRDCIAPTCAEI